MSSDPHLPLCQDLEREDEVEEQERTAEEKKREGGGEAEGEEGEIKVSEVAISTEFSLKEVRDYCLPDRDSVLFRHSLRTSRECPITVQLTTSKRDAHIKLEVLTHTHTHAHTHTQTISGSYNNLIKPAVCIGITVIYSQLDYNTG